MSLKKEYNKYTIKKYRKPNGFVLIKDYLTKDEELKLIKRINSNKWVVDYNRRLQYYGYRNELVKPYDLIPAKDKIPSFLKKLISRMYDDGLVDEKPDQIIVNEYTRGQGLKPHTDRKDYFKNTIVGLSLQSGTAMQFINKSGEKRSIYIPQRSLYIMRDDYRYIWKHAIPPRVKDIVDGKEIARKTRISITFRNVVPNKVKYENITYPNSKVE